MGEYAGESLAKKVARVRMYLRAKDMLNASGITDQLGIVVLPGPDASEAGCLRHILKPAYITAVDRDQECIDRFFDKTEEFLDDDDLLHMTTMGYTGDLKNFTPHHSIAFANLDLMTNLNGQPGDIISSCMGHLRVGGVVALTYLRAREFGGTRETLSATRKFIHSLPLHRKFKKLLGPDRGRTAAMFAEIQHGMFRHCIMKAKGYPIAEQLGVDYDDPNSIADAALVAAEEMAEMYGLSVWPIAAHSYQANVSPMGIVMAQLLQGKKNSAYRKKLYCNGARRPHHERRLISSTIKRDPMGELLVEADELSKKGYTPKQVADIFDVSVGTMAAWKAHRTMGTYN